MNKNKEESNMKKALSVVLILAILLAIPAITSAVESPETELPPPEIEEIIEEVQTIYRLTIYYIYLDGTTAAPTYTRQLEAGTHYNVVSPEITGYTPTMAVVSGVMPARDVEYTVIYIPAPDPSSPGTPGSFLTIDDYDSPLGLGASYMHVGICIE